MLRARGDCQTREHICIPGPREPSCRPYKLGSIGIRGRRLLRPAHCCPPHDIQDPLRTQTEPDSATSTSAIYRKDDYVLSAVAISGDQVDSYYERIWSDTSRHDDIVCGKLSTSANYQCAGAEDGSGVLVSGSAETAEETAQILAALLEEIGSP